MTRLLECPKCHNKLLVQRSADIYQCVGCNFKRDFSKSSNSSRPAGGTFLWLFLSMFLVTFFVWNQTYTLSPETESQGLPAEVLQQSIE
jgi:hypothetical protein